MSTVTELPPIISAEEDLEQTLKALQSPRLSVKSGQNVETLEATKSPSPSVKSGQEENVEAKNTPRSSVVENLPPVPDGESPPTEDPGKELEETIVEENREVDDSTKAPQQSEPPENPQSLELPRPSEKPGSRRVSFSDETNPAGKGSADQPFSGGFISNKGVKQPSLRDTLLLDSDSGEVQIGASNTVAERQHRQPPWVVAVVCLLVLTVLMRFSMSTFSFLGLLVYAALVSMLALRFVGYGPFNVIHRAY